MKTLKADQLTSDFVECSFANALLLCKGDELQCESAWGEYLLITFASGLQIKINNGDEPVPYSDVTPDLDYDHPHVFVRTTGIKCC